nr:zf-HC2 domain-containing protein [Duganella sp. 1224]
MSGRVVRLDIPEHQAVRELLPWYASAQLSADETRRVHEHLQGCAQCRYELEWEYGMRTEAAMRADQLPDGVDMERALARLLPALGPQERTAPANTAAPTGAAHVAPANIAAQTATGHAAPADIAADADTAAAQGTQRASAAPGTPQRVAWWRAAAANQSSWLRWAVAAQWVTIIGLGTLLLRPDDTPAYRVLGASAAAGGNMVVMFQPNTSERELRRILQAQNARIVDGPTVTDAWLLNVPADRHAQVLQALRANAAVKLAEPLDGEARP